MDISIYLFFGCVKGKSGDTEGADDTKVSKGAKGVNLYCYLSKMAILSIFRDLSVLASNLRFIHF